MMTSGWLRNGLLTKEFQDLEFSLNSFSTDDWLTVMITITSPFKEKDFLGFCSLHVFLEHFQNNSVDDSGNRLPFLIRIVLELVFKLMMGTMMIQPATRFL